MKTEVIYTANCTLSLQWCSELSVERPRVINLSEKVGKKKTAISIRHRIYKMTTKNIYSSEEHLQGLPY